ncbi:hypothetical protein CPC08DRAFT_711257 [Agrocybe pediades]|nr:hypothetical protein CPC08DRAFT_711257 [Agrocybe pediades]
MRPVTARDGVNDKADFQSKEVESLTGQENTIIETPSHNGHDQITSAPDPSRNLPAMGSEDNPFNPEPLDFEIIEEEVEAVGEIERILEDLEDGKVDETLFPVFDEEDVALDMDENVGEGESESDEDSMYGSDEE